MLADKHTQCNDVIRFFKRTLVISSVLIFGLFPFTASAFDILLGTGKTGTFSHFTGRTLCRIINKHANDMNCNAVSAPDDVDNLTNLQGGSLDISLIDSSMLHDAVKKAGIFKFLDISYNNIRAILPFYDVPITLVVRKDAKINSLQALKGKRINTGAPHSPQRRAMNTIMKAKNWSKGDFSLIEELPASQSQDTMSFCHGTIQAMVHVGIHPDPSLRQLFKLCKAGLVNMDDSDIENLIRDHPAFSRIDIAADTYPDQPKTVSTFGTKAVLVATDDLDTQSVYRIIDAIYRDKTRLKRAHPMLSPFSKDRGIKDDAVIELHPGAAKFFSEHGF